MTAFRSTAYFRHVRQHAGRGLIQDKWVLRAVLAPLWEQAQSDGRIRRFVRIPEFQNRTLRVTLLEDRVTVHQAFFDRDFTEDPPMKIKFFEDTDTAMFVIGSTPVAETRELSEDIYLDFDAKGHVVAITVEHASERGDLGEITFARIADQEAKVGAARGRTDRVNGSS